jgi:glycosyltransferase involved in cell wall biosynthesis
MSWNDRAERCPLRIAVCRPQVPFVRGGAELMADRLVDELRRRGHEAETVSIPFKWYPGTRVLDQAFLWRLVDLTESDGRAIDLVIATKFPAYCVRHPNKVAWVLHQFRQAYDYDRTDLGQFSEAPEDRATIRALERLDRVALGEARKVFATSRNIADRLKRYTDVDAELLPHPPQELAYRTQPGEGFVLSVNRLDSAKRIDLLVEAARAEPSLRVVIVGEGPDRERLERLAGGMNGQVVFAGRVDEDALADLYARCSAVYSAPVDEDFGMVPYEAFLSAKPVLTTTDAGGPLEVVHDRETGLVVAPEARELARAAAYVAAHEDEAAAWGRAGKAVAERVTWDACVDALLS